MKKEKINNPTPSTPIELQERHRKLDPEALKKLKIEARHFYYPQTKVYKNKYLITNQKKLAEVYSRDTKQMMAELRAAPLPEQFNSSYLKNLHKQIFSKVFEWAGHTRDEPFKFANGSIAAMPSLKKKEYKKAFATGTEIQQGLQKLDEMLLTKDELRNLTREEFVEHASQVMAHLYSLNPFREGNRHTVQLFVEKLGQAAGCELDFSLVSKKRKELIRYEAVNNNNSEPIKRLLDDISHPARSLILREFIDSMRELGLDEKHYHPAVVAQEGHTYRGIYRGSGAEGFMVDIHGTYVVAHKKYLAPEQVKALKIGDHLSFTAPLAQEVQKVLIPGENVPALSNEELSQRVYESSPVQNSIKKIESLCQIVYGKQHALQGVLSKFKIPITHEDFKRGEKLAQDLEKFPQRYHKLRGINVCGLKSGARQHATENFLPLGHAMFQYIHALKQVEKDILESHSAEQQRCTKSVEMPSRQLNNLFLSSKEQQRETLLSSPELRAEIEDYFLKLNERLSPNEHKAINEKNDRGLAKSLGISMSQTEEITTVVRQTKEIYDIVQQQHREMDKQKVHDAHQSLVKNGSEPAAAISTTRMKEENIVEFTKKNKPVEERFIQNHQKSIAR
ncbi:BID domain-containing T4SS effector [Bartonella phoceensis]|uniref:BID domain-containing T4SS effector n=1 Tax=Bartonella phoceensis TaxID=270249 RepID=UPI001ABBB79D|nr:BID domain-containing T4SS effector [Bartonella phoceensis]